MRINTEYALSTAQMSCKRRTLVDEASTSRFNNPYRLYDDSCDFGVWVKSHKTGELVAFTYNGPESDRNGDVTAWTFSNDRYGMILRIFND